MKLILPSLMLFAGLFFSIGIKAQTRPGSVTVVPEGMKPDTVATSLEKVDIYPFAVHNVRFSPDGNLVASGHGSGHVRVWNSADGSLRWTAKAHTNWAFSVAWLPDGQRLLSGGGDDLVALFDIAASDQPRKVFRGHLNDVHAVAVTRDGKTLFSAGDDWSVLLWDAEGDAPRRKLTGHTRQIPTLALSPDERMIATGSRDASIRLWNAASGEETDVLIGHTADVMSVVFSPDGSMLASASYDRTVRLWNVARGKALRVMQGHTDRVYSVVFSPDGKRLASAGDATLRLWEVETGKLLGTYSVSGRIQAPKGVVPERLSSVDFSPDSRLLAAGSTTGKSYLIEAASGKILHEMFVPVPARN